MLNKTLLLITLCLAFIFQNCKSTDGDEDPTPIVLVAPEVTLPPVINNVDGVLAAIITSTKSAGVETKAGTAHAVFFNNKNMKSFLDGGKVTINGNATSKTDANIYFFAAGTSNPTGITYGTQILWSVTGNTATDVPAISNNDGSGFPNVLSVPEVINLSKDQDFQLNWGSGIGGDSIIIFIQGPSANYRRALASGTSSHVITMAEIAKLGAGVGRLQLFNYKLTTITKGTKTYALLKQCVGLCNRVNITQ